MSVQAFMFSTAKGDTRVESHTPTPEISGFGVPCQLEESTLQLEEFTLQLDMVNLIGFDLPQSD